MSHFVIFVFTFLLVRESLCSELKCNTFNNEEVSCMGSCPPEPSCKNRGIQFRCKEEKCELKCTCKQGYLRNLNGNCISEKNCDLCNEKNNEYYECGGFCDNVCSELSSQNKTHCPVKNIKCNEKCYCKDGYARNSQNMCVPISQCDLQEAPVEKRSIKQVSHCNDPNEEYFSCKKSCPPDTCISLIAKFRCPELAEQVCEAGCRCKSGFLRKMSGTPCIPIKQCPQLAHSPDFN